MIALMFLCTMLLVPAPAFAGDYERAEHIRLSEEMRKLAQRTNWTAVEGAYQKLEALEAQGEVLSFEELNLGFESARALGNITAARARAAKALKLKDTPEIVNALSDIDANYGRVEIRFDKRYGGERELVVVNPPFDPIQRSAITYAVGRMQAGEDFLGLLPAGEYSIAGRKFVSVPGEAKVAQVVVAPQAGEKTQSGLAYVGPRISVGLNYSAATEAGASEGPEPGAFAGLGPRAGVGLEIGFSRTVGLVGEVGYHGFFPGTGATADLAEEHANMVNLGYGFVGLGLRFGDFWASAGPVYSIGVGSVAQYYCDGAFADACEGGTAARLSGLMKMGGGELNLAYALVGLGSLDLALTLTGAAQTDLQRLYPWGQVALTLAPSGEKPKKTAKAGGT